MSNAEKFKRMSRGLDLVQAIAEADRCLLCHDAPCSEACPADTKPAEFIRKLRFKNMTGAFRTIKENNILGGACGVLCPTSSLCEEKCSAMFKSQNRPEGADHPIQIGAIQRFLVEHFWHTDVKVFETPTARKEKVAVVGSGPGGLSCAAELAKAGYRVTVLEAKPEPGGVLRYGVVSSRFDMNFLEHEMDDIKSLGVQFQCNAAVNGPAGAEELLQNGFDAVFLAPGLWAAASIKSTGRDIDGLFSSVDYLSALRDGRFEEVEKKVQGKTVAVIGGGSVAMDCVESAMRLEAKDVYLIYRRSYSQMPAEADERIEALNSGVHFLLLNQPLDYLTDDQNRLLRLKLVRTRLAEPDESGRRRPENIEGSEWIMDTDVVIEAIGNIAPEDSPQWYPNVDIDDKKLIQVDPETGKTSVDGIFAGGDIVRGPALVVQAVQDGKVAAAAIDIIANCHNGYLIDPLDTEDIGSKLLAVLSDRKRWDDFADNGLSGVQKYYSWQAHIEKYMDVIRPLISRKEVTPPFHAKRRNQLHHDRALFSDLDQNLLGNPQALKPFVNALQANRKCVLFGIATGRRRDSAIRVLKKYKIPIPNVLITSLGTEIYYNPNLVEDAAWNLHIDYLWNPRIIRRALQELPGMKLQPRLEQNRFKISYFIDPQIAPDTQHINKLLHQEGQAANVVLSFGQYLDIIPIRASKGLAMRWVAERHDIALDRILAAGGSGADEDMMRGNMLAVVVANRHNEELSDLIEVDEIFFASRPYAEGILEAIELYDFFETCEMPDS